MVSHESLGPLFIGRAQHPLPLFDHRLGPSVVHRLRRQQPDSRVMVLRVVPPHKFLTKSPRILDLSKALRKLRPVLQRLELALRIYGLSFETCGRLCVFVIPRSASNKATGLDVIDVPRSAWIVSCSGAMFCLPLVSPISRLANSALSRGATIHPTTYRL